MRANTLGAIVILLAAIPCLSRATPEKSSADPSDAGPIPRTLDDIRVKHNIPALARAVVVEGKNQPRGHTRRWFSGLRAVPRGPGADNPPAFSACDEAAWKLIQQFNTE